ncbi:conserved membrane hypothetical protein [Gammaproteobacteria bacterium]
MKLLFGIITLIGALFISTIAAYFSIIGLAIIFAAAFMPVVVMTGVLEAGKIIASVWLHTNWSNVEVSWIHKIYLTLAIIALMLVTAVGIYGFLSKGYFEQKAPLASVNFQIIRCEQSIAQVEHENVRFQNNLDQLDKFVDAYLKNDKITISIKERKEQKVERDAIQNQLDKNMKEISRLNDELLSFRMKTNDIETELGPIKYVAMLFGLQDTSKAVRTLILLLMFAFDPLAIVLILSASISLREYFAAKAITKNNSYPTDK